MPLSKEQERITIAERVKIILANDEDINMMALLGRHPCRHASTPCAGGVVWALLVTDVEFQDKVIAKIRKRMAELSEYRSGKVDFIVYNHPPLVPSSLRWLTDYYERHARYNELFRLLGRATDRIIELLPVIPPLVPEQTK